jgi:outer membrane protein
MSTSISADSYATKTQTFRLGGVAITISDDVATAVDLTHIDATLYYELLDNWISLDVGLTARQFSGYVEVDSQITGQVIGNLEGVIPMLYANARIDLPFSGWHLGAQTNLVSYSKNGVQDFSGLIGYELDLTALDVGLNIGYRTMLLQVEDFDDLYADAEVSGLFAELQIHF